MSRLKDRVIVFMLGMQREVTGEEIAKAIERARRRSDSEDVSHAA